MNVTESAISLNVPDIAASAAFVRKHFGFVAEMDLPEVVSLRREDVGFSLIFLPTGLKTFKPAEAAGSAGMGLLVAFVVDDIDAEYARLRAEGVQIVTPMETEEWGERYFQMRDPNGVIYQLVQWVTSPPAP
ncbi:VOC family protein [Deinococcus marmoris]|uniref:VOC family protein n=1 Tax=Deinococcus marmoris TaxID=249408 RepID=UPI000496BE63|nr:VOC family protein [Deinococcus marmoris]